MATIPKIVTLTNTSVDVLNTIRDNASVNYKDYVPVATADANSIRVIGGIIMDYPDLRNEFLGALVNRIGMVLLKSKLYENPLRLFKRGILDFGETTEEVFVQLAKGVQFDPEAAETNLFARHIPDVRAAFHVMNFQKVYPTTVQNDQLRQAFLSWTGITDLISKIIDSLQTGANYDEFQVTKYMLARQILDGRVYPFPIPTVTDASMKEIAADIKTVSNDFEFMSSDRNVAGVKTFTLKDSQMLLTSTYFDAHMDVQVLASAFNMDKAHFMGRRVLVDGFGKIDSVRLSELFEGDTTYRPLTDAEKTALNAIPAILIDEDYFMIYDNYINMTDQYNSLGLYWNYFLHTWKTFSVSPFAQTTIFVPGTSTVTSVTVNPATATVAQGQQLELNVTVVTDNFAPKSVVWSVNNDKCTISPSGKLTIGADATGKVIATATSTADAKKTGTCTVTVSSGT